VLPFIPVIHRAGDEKIEPPCGELHKPFFRSSWGRPKLACPPSAAPLPSPVLRTSSDSLTPARSALAGPPPLANSFRRFPSSSSPVRGARVPNVGGALPRRRYERGEDLSHFFHSRASSALNSCRHISRRLVGAMHEMNVDSINRTSKTAVRKAGAAGVVHFAPARTAQP
jgi:hypothetical protein